MARQAEVNSSRIRKLIGSDRDYFRTPDGRPMYDRVRGKKGWDLRKIGATDACIMCGMPREISGFVTFAHIHMHDLHLSPRQCPTRVFCLCWQHHHGCYDQGYISTLALLEAEKVWIENKPRPRRPTPPKWATEIARKVNSGELRHDCVWTKGKIERLPTFNPKAFYETQHPDAVREAVREAGRFTTKQSFTFRL